MGTSTASGIAPETVAPSSAVHDFDFYMGKWRVHHRRLVERLAGNDEWQEFEGTSEAWPILDGAGNIDDNVLELPAGTYRAISLRTFDPATDTMVHLVARWAHPGPPRSARRGQLRGRHRHVHRRGHVQWPADPGSLRVVRDHRELVPLGAGLLAGRRRGVGGQLGDGVNADRIAMSADAAMR